MKDQEEGPIARFTYGVISGLFTGGLEVATATVRRETVGGGPVSTSTAGAWCHITYHQYRDHIGTPGSSLPVHADSVHVFSGLHEGAQGLCLSAVRHAAKISSQV